ncbi:hypothetical protein K7I13_00145 [Brucepastera parasyntrophica]|uniref:DUF6115 domain-containing protein n=1 Tax=Brucepastera parasyntrophica TaxID=2880008 RepID=UPI00210E22B8|nr:hypothetical protein [Brucepastera parasyntrophica]ULQ59813.1 hypothetical protein K7I13_00145 [Brucepastera parasyntrophica]
MDGTVIFSILLLAVNILIMIIFYFFLKSRFSSDKILANLQEEVNGLITDIDKAADRDIAILEARIQQLRSLIALADQRILVAEREVKKRQEAASLTEALQKEPERVPPKPVQVIDIGRLSGENKPEPAKAAHTETESPVVVYSRPKVRHSPDQIRPQIPVKEQVIELAEQGFSAEIIAKRLSISPGEVELILDLNIHL